MTIVITIIHIIVCLVLILVILVQGGRGQGITGPQFGNGNVQTLFGTRAGDFLTKATTVSAIVFLFTCIGLNMIEAHKSKSLLEASRPKTPVDVESIKKALEKIKEGADPSSVVTTEKTADGSSILKVTQDKPFSETSSADAKAQVQQILDQAAAQTEEAAKTLSGTAAAAKSEIVETQKQAEQAAAETAAQVQTEAAKVNS